MEEAYSRGTVGSAAKRIYDILSASGGVPLHDLKLLGGFPLREIARITGLPMGTTAWKYRNALQTLKEAAHHES